MRIFLYATAAICIVTACDGSNTKEHLPVETYPTEVSDMCRNGVAQIYDECSDQTTILRQARASAAASGKTVLVVYGAEWCIWCHVFEKYVQGQSRRYEYKYEYDGEPQYWPMREHENRNAEAQARQLNRYVANNFVIAHIESYYSPNGEEVLASTGFDASNIVLVPLIVVLDNEGKYSGNMRSADMIDGLEIRNDSGEEYRGYDRTLLLRELKRLRRISTMTRVD